NSVLFALIGVEMPPELRREEERTRRTKYEGPEPSKKRITKKRSRKQPAKRKRQQSVNQADKPTTDADKAVEAAQQLVAFKKFAVARQKAVKAVPYNSCLWRSKKTRRPRTFATADSVGFYWHNVRTKNQNLSDINFQC